MICLVGFMGAGKSTALGELGRQGLGTIDLDEAIEERAGRSIPEIFSREGEDAFRKIEEEVALEVIQKGGFDAVALGGGAVTSDSIRQALADPDVQVVWLDVSPELAWERVSGSDRPLAGDRSSFDRLFRERELLYMELADAILPGGSSFDVAELLPLVAGLGDLPAGTRLLWAPGTPHGYPIFVGPSLLGTDLLRPTGPILSRLGGRSFTVTDEEVGAIHGGALDDDGSRITVPAGEASKSLATTESVMRELARLGAGRGDHLIALGGGVVGDLVGFCAATYQRGIAVVQVPTSLVAQVDSAYGGKTGVDLPEGKNYVGAFHLPAAVVSDTTLLATLPEAELAAGMAEVIKTGLLAGGHLWEEVRRLEPGEILSRPDIVFGCARYKCQVVSADERDSGLRAVLNLGHTVGHAIETATGYTTYRHGEAVALGLLAAMRLSGADELRAEIAELNERHGLPLEMDSGIDPGKVVDAVAFDKKKTEAGVGFVLLSEPGSPRINCLVEKDDLVAAVGEISQ